MTAPRNPFRRPGSTREGFGGEKAACKSASLPVPTIPQTTNQPIIAAQQSLRSASGEVEQKREWVLSAEKREEPFAYFAALSPRAGRPQPSPTPTRTRHRHPAGRRGCGGRRTRPLPPTANATLKAHGQAERKAHGQAEEKSPRPGGEKSSRLCDEKGGIYAHRAPRGGLRSSRFWRRCCCRPLSQARERARGANCRSKSETDRNRADILHVDLQRSHHLFRPLVDSLGVDGGSWLRSSATRRTRAEPLTT